MRAACVKALDSRAMHVLMNIQGTEVDHPGRKLACCA